MSYTIRCRCGCFQGDHSREFRHGRNDWYRCFRCPCEQYEEAARPSAPAGGEQGGAE